MTIGATVAMVLSLTFFSLPLTLQCFIWLVLQHVLWSVYFYEIFLRVGVVFILKKKVKGRIKTILLGTKILAIEGEELVNNLLSWRFTRETSVSPLQYFQQNKHIFTSSFLLCVTFFLFVFGNWVFFTSLQPSSCHSRRFPGPSR